MSDEQQQVSNQISIEDLELSLEVYEIESDQKLQKLKQLFNEKKSLDLRQLFYEQRSSLEVKFQNIIGDLTEFLVNQQVPSTQKMRKTFYRILQSPFLLLFKVSRFQIFNLRLNAFDIELQPIDAICELARLLYKNIDEYVSRQKNEKIYYVGSTYESFEDFLEHAKINLIQDQIFILYSYLRKGSGILKKKIEDKIKVVEIFTTIEQKLISTLLKNEDVKTLKELSILNYQIYLLEQSFDVLCFYLKVPFRNIYKEVFKELQNLAARAKQASNYDMFINIFVKFNQEIINKIKVQKIDDGYVEYLENIAKTLLDLWGCRLCQYREFYAFYRLLFEVYPDRIKLLQICLKHTPSLNKEDIALIRANYRQNVENKNSELISFMKKVSLDDINSELNSIYHQIMYNLDFEILPKEKIIQIFSLVNGNSSLEQFIVTVSKAFKEWNHTIDFNNPLKYIETEFSVPKNLSHAQILESLRLFTNLCILQFKGFTNDFQELVNKGTIVKAISGISKLLIAPEQERVNFLKENVIVQKFIYQSFQFLHNTLQNSSPEWGDLLLLLAESIKYFSDQQIQQKIKTYIFKKIEKDLQNYKLGNCIKILRKVYQFSSQASTLDLVAGLFMNETAQKIKETKNFRFFGQNINKMSNQLLSKQEVQFLKKYACIKGDVIDVKQPSCLKLTELQVITNPIQFEKAMDNYYFTLDPNAKHFIQYIVEEWSNLISIESSFFAKLISLVVKNYPVCVAVLCNIRIKTNQNVKENIQFRFAEYLVNKLNGSQSSQAKQILALIIACETIKYRNGRDYVVEEIVPMITKRLLTLINSSNLIQSTSSISLEHYEILAMCLQRFKLSDLKIDTIQKSLLKINYQIETSDSQKSIARLSKAFDQIIRLFFRKKQLDIKKKGLEEAYEKIAWNEIRNYNRSSSSSLVQQKTQKQQPVINQQIVVSPFTLSQEYDNQEYKIKKTLLKVLTISDENTDENKVIKFSQVLSSIPSVEVQSSSLRSLQISSIGQIKQIDLSSMKYDVELYLGKDNLSQLENKQNWVIRQKNKEARQSNQSQSTEKSVTFVQYYLREMSPPEISQVIALKSILSYLKGEMEISLIWSNPKNLEKLFVPLVILFDLLTENSKNCFKIESSAWNQIIEYARPNLIRSLKQILNLFSDLGYHNLWGQNYSNFDSYSDLLKQISLKVVQNESFLSIVLKRCLQFGQLKEITAEIDLLFEKIFSTRPSEQTSLMYKVGFDKNLLNLIMKSLQIKNLSNISFLFHSNFNNLRLYTDQLHEGLKALNMASKTRSYNEYIQLSKQIQDEQFLGPMKLFQENFKFFIKIQREGYNFKKTEERKLCLQRLANLLRQYSLEQKQTIAKQCDKIIEQYQEEVQKLQLSIANRVKSFYLVTKLRDLSYQNAISITLISQILREKKVDSQHALEQIKKVEIFSLLMNLHKELVLFDNSWDNFAFYERYNVVDRNYILNQVNFCTTRRFSHSMSKVYEKCDLELDEVIQRCLNQLKLFLSTAEGRLYLQQNKANFYPGFFVKSFIKVQQQNRNELVQQIRKSLQKGTLQSEYKIKIKKGQFISEFLSQLKNINTKFFFNKNLILIEYEEESKTFEQFLQILVAALIKNQTLVWVKTKDSQFLTFNKYKTSEATLLEIELLGYLVGYCVYHRLPLVQGQNEILPLHSSIIAAFSFNIIDIEDLLHVDFKIWEDVKRVLSIEDSKTLNLNFSYIFQNIKTLQQQRIELVDKGASKKVNNLNREQFCDAIASHVLFKNISQQLTRFIQSILIILPKQLLSCYKVSEVYPIFYNKQNVENVIKKYMKKIGIITPEVVLKDGKRIQNLRDYQNIQWAAELILQNKKLQDKLWQDQSNIFIVTTIGPKPSLRFKDQLLIIEHFESKEMMSASLKQLQ